QEEIQSRLGDLKKQREELLGLKRAGRRRSLEYLKQTQAERRKIASEFQRLHQFLEEQEQLLLARLGDVDRQIARRHKENATKLAGEISLLNVLITDAERKCQQPATEFLKDVRNTWSRCNKLHSQKPTETFLELERKLSAFSHHTVALRETLRKCQDTLTSHLDKDWEKSPGTDGKTNVTLDPDTANPWLLLSADQKCVSWVAARQDLPVRHQRFYSSRCVLGCQGFTSGRRSWEVEPGLSGAWAVGVSRASVGRKGWVNFCPEEGIWAVGLSGDQYRAFTSPVAPLSLNHVPERICISVDYEKGRVAFSSADHTDPIFTFPEAYFSGEKIFPFFWVGRGSWLRLCP
ncbi:E3 ubiquitin-protein ligase TRIM7-like, partial [Alligator sinensis]|uniref:E3 ubiquitin-protein ligase TRIM7-like n=1 Tax=Alligator sinensis TaxID=38654 RepID=A0A3Q0FWS0_ALLSI